MSIDVDIDDGPLILVVDDDQFHPALAARFLEPAGFRVLQADGPIDALEKLDVDGARPAVAIVRNKMTALDGLTLAAIIRQRVPSVKIVLTTDASRVAEIAAGVASGIAEAVIMKPWDPDELVDLVRRLAAPTFTAPVGDYDPGDAEATATRESTTILVVDDNALMRAATRDLLTFLGYTVMTAEDGPAGIEAARSGSPALVLLDLVMPGMDGFEVCRTLKADHETQAIPVVIVTARCEASTMDGAIEVGVEEVLLKPIDPGSLVDVITRTLATQ